MEKKLEKNKKEKTTILYDLSPGSEKDPIKVCNKEKESIYRNMRRQIKFQICFYQSNVEINYFDKATFP